jgi:hypothetical protein
MLAQLSRDGHEIQLFRTIVSFVQTYFSCALRICSASETLHLTLLATNSARALRRRSCPSSVSYRSIALSTAAFLSPYGHGSDRRLGWRDLGLASRVWTAGEFR